MAYAIQTGLRVNSTRLAWLIALQRVKHEQLRQRGWQLFPGKHDTLSPDTESQLALGLTRGIAVYAGLTLSRCSALSTSCCGNEAGSFFQVGYHLRPTRNRTPDSRCCVEET